MFLYKGLFCANVSRGDVCGLLGTLRCAGFQEWDFWERCGVTSSRGVCACYWTLYYRVGPRCAGVVLCWDTIFSRCGVLGGRFDAALVACGEPHESAVRYIC